MMRALLAWMTRRLPAPRVVYDRMGESPYLSRYYLVGRTRAEEEDPRESPRRTARGVLLPARDHGCYLHHFHRGDDELELHSHPWAWSLSLILAGGYIEERRFGAHVVRRTMRPWRLNYIGANDFHRVELLEHDCWTLFLTGPKIAGWGFWNKDTERFLPWRQFIRELRDPGEPRAKLRRVR